MVPVVALLAVVLAAPQIQHVMVQVLMVVNTVIPWFPMDAAAAVIVTPVLLAADLLLAVHQETVLLLAVIIPVMVW